MTLSNHYLNASPSYQRAKALGNRHVPLARSTTTLRDMMRDTVGEQQ